MKLINWIKQLFHRNDKYLFYDEKKKSWVFPAF